LSGSDGSPATKFEGSGNTLYLHVARSRIADENLRELLAFLSASSRQAGRPEAWFGENLVTPDRFNRSKSKGFYRRKTRGIAWFRDSATDCLSRMHRMKVILEKYGHAITILTETRVGYVTYEDELQIVAEPFSDTKTG